MKLFLTFKSYLLNRDPLLLSFLSNAVGLNVNLCNDQLKLYQLSVIVESVYHLRNQNMILPHCFVAKLIKTFISGSKTLSALNGKLLPAASDTTYRDWLKANSSKKLTPPEDVNLYVYFDNIRKYMVKNYRVSTTKNLTPDVVTALLNIVLKSDALPLAQYVESLKPKDTDFQTFFSIRFLKVKRVYLQFRLSYSVSECKYQ